MIETIHKMQVRQEGESVLLIINGRAVAQMPWGAALEVSRDACRAYALDRSWENSARQFIGHLQKVAIRDSSRPSPELAVTAAAHG